MVVDPVWVVVLEVPVPGDGFPEVVGELAVVGWGEGVGLGEGVGRAAVDEAEVVVVPFGLEKGLEKGVEIVGKKGRVMEGRRSVPDGPEEGELIENGDFAWELLREVLAKG